METLTDRIFHLSSAADFEAAALRVFGIQYDGNAVYRAYCQNVGVKKEEVHTLSDIPFLPISFFKTHDVVTGDFVPELTFRSSGTTGMQHSVHLIRDALRKMSSGVKSPVFTSCDLKNEMGRKGMFDNLETLSGSMLRY